MHIDDYGFGRIVINNNTYTSDVIVYPEVIAPSWWRKEGHSLQESDLKDIVSVQPDILVIGTGYYGAMQVPKKTTEFLKSKGIVCIIDKTGKAVEVFNSQPRDRKVVGAFHLTC